MKTYSLAFVLDYLRDGPAHLDTLYRDAWAQFAFSHEQVQDALRRLCVVARKRPQDGEVFVMRPLRHLVGQVRDCPPIQRHCQRRERRVISRATWKIFQSSTNAQINEETT